MQTRDEMLGRAKALSAEVTATMADTSLSTTEKKSFLDKATLEREEIACSISNLAKAKAFQAAGDLTTPLPPFKGGRRRPGPALALDDAQVRGLHQAIVTGATARAETKAFSPDLGGLLPAQLVGQPIGMLHEPDRVLNHFPTSATDAPSVEYIRHASTTGVPATVAPGAVKPELTLNTATLVATARKIAAHTAATMESLLDFRSFQGYVMNELTRQVIDVENAQLLLGDGVGTNLLGLLNQTGILTRAVNTGANEVGIDTLEQAITDLRVGSAFAVGDLIVLNPATWSKLRRTKDTQGRYLVEPDPTADEARTLWGVDVAVTTVMPAGTALVAATESSAHIYQRDALTVMTSSQSGSDFTSNVVRFVAEERLALAVERPAGLCKVTGL